MMRFNELTDDDRGREITDKHVHRAARQDHHGGANQAGPQMIVSYLLQGSGELPGGLPRSAKKKGHMDVSGRWKVLSGRCKVVGLLPYFNRTVLKKRRRGQLDVDVAVAWVGETG
jgi:hypothetical protein